MNGLPLCDGLGDGVMWLIVGIFLYGVKALGDRNAKQFGWSKWDATHLRNTVMARIFWIPMLGLGIVCILRHVAR
jgi:hypothetical protein